MNVSCSGASAPRSRIFWRLVLFASITLSTGAAASGEESAGAVVYRVDSTHSSVDFSIMKWVVTRQVGSFRQIEGTIRMAPDCPESAEVEIRVHAASLDTRNSGRDRVVRSDDFLDVEAHPYLTFSSVAVRRNQAGSFDVEGNLTIRGVTRRIITPVQMAGVTEVKGFGELLSFEAAFTVDRRDFGVLGTRWSGGKTILGDEVEVRLTVTARRVKQEVRDRGEPVDDEESRRAGNLRPLLRLEG